jgi:hypothetical protein
MKAVRKILLGITAVLFPALAIVLAGEGFFGLAAAFALLGALDAFNLGAEFGSGR